MPWTRQQVKFLLSKGSPLSPEQEAKMKSELHADPAMGHARKGSKALKKARVASAPAEAKHLMPTRKLHPKGDW
jgi:hypothetical protein